MTDKKYGKFQKHFICKCGNYWNPSFGNKFHIHESICPKCGRSIRYNVTEIVRRKVYTRKSPWYKFWYKRWEWEWETKNHATEIVDSYYNYNDTVVGWILFGLIIIMTTAIILSSL